MVVHGGPTQHEHASRGSRGTSPGRASESTWQAVMYSQLAEQEQEICTHRFEQGEVGRMRRGCSAERRRVDRTKSEEPSLKMELEAVRDRRSLENAKLRTRNRADSLERQHELVDRVKTLG